MSRRRRVADSEDAEENHSISSGDEANDTKDTVNETESKDKVGQDLTVDAPEEDDQSDEEQKPNRRSRRKEDPASVPRTGKFFLHDDRETSNTKGVRRREKPFEKPPSSGKSDDSMWKHDKFEELVAQEERKDRRPKYSDKSSAKKSQTGDQRGKERNNVDENKEKQRIDPRKGQNDHRESKENKEKKEYAKKRDVHKGNRTSEKNTPNESKDIKSSGKVDKSARDNSNKGPKHLEKTSNPATTMQSIVEPAPNTSASDIDSNQKSPKSPDTPAVLNPAAREFQPFPTPPIPQSQPSSKPTPVSSVDNAQNINNNRNPNYPMLTQPNIVPPDQSAPYSTEPYVGAVPAMHLYPPIPPTAAPYPVYDPAMMYHLQDGTAAMSGLPVGNPGTIWYSDPSAMYYNAPVQPTMNNRSNNRNSQHRRKPVVRDSPLNSNSPIANQQDNQGKET